MLDALKLVHDPDAIRLQFTFIRPLNWDKRLFPEVFRIPFG